MFTHTHTCSASMFLCLHRKLIETYKFERKKSKNKDKVTEQVACLHQNKIE